MGDPEQSHTFDVVNMQDQILKYLLNDIKTCPLRDFDINIIKEIGSGMFGVVYLVNIDGKEYVMKEKSSEIPKYRITSEISGNDAEYYYNFFVNNMGIGEGVGRFLMFKALNPNLKGREGELVLFQNVRLCSMENDLIVERTDDVGTVTIPKDSYLCEEEQHSEYYLMLIVSTLYNDGVSIHFINIYSFAACVDSDRLNEYIIMDKLDLSVKDLDLNNLEDFVVDSIFVQILQAIAAMETLEIVHNDMNPGNIMLEKIHPDSEYLGQSLDGVKYFHYRVYGKNIYIPATKYVVKIIDYGLSIKWSSPIVGNKNVITGDIYEGWLPPPTMPNWNNTVIDVYRVSKFFFREAPRNAFVKKISSWVLGMDLDSTRESIQNTYELTSFSDNPLPEFVSSSFNHVSATNILLNKKLIFPYIKTQKSVTLGTL